MSSPASRRRGKKRRRSAAFLTPSIDWLPPFIALLLWRFFPFFFLLLLLLNFHLFLFYPIFFLKCLEPQPITKMVRSFFFFNSNCRLCYFFFSTKKPYHDFHFLFLIRASSGPFCSLFIYLLYPLISFLGKSSFSFCRAGGAGDRRHGEETWRPSRNS